MKDLTNGEEEIMQILWELEKAFVKDIVDRMPDPKPAYNTVSTIVRILERKGFVGHNTFGKTHQYYPLVKKDEYSGSHLRGFVRNYFSNSYRQLVSFFASNENLSVEEMEELKKLFEEAIRKQKE